MRQHHFWWPDAGGSVQTVDVSMMTPLPCPWGVSDEEAIELCREWMVHLGATDARKAEESAKHVWDLYSSHYLGWVETRRGNLDVDLVERAATAAAVDGRSPLLFLPGGVYPEARDRADVLGVPLLRFRAKDGVLDGVNMRGQQARTGGLVTP